MKTFQDYNLKQDQEDTLEVDLEVVVLVVDLEEVVVVLVADQEDQSDSGELPLLCRVESPLCGSALDFNLRRLGGGATDASRQVAG